MAQKYRHKPTTCGIAYHGLVQSGELTLPSGAVRTIAQPEARNILLDPARTAGPGSSDFDAENEYDWKSRLLIPGNMGIGDNRIIYLDGSNTPYLVSFAVTTPGTFTIRVVATLHQEFGVFGEPRQDWQVQIFDQTIDLADAGLAGYLSAGGVDGPVEQSPDGRSVLLNMLGGFSGGNLLQANSRKLAGIIKATISGTVSPLDGSGLSGSLSVYKTAAECSGELTSEVTSSYTTRHWERTRTVSYGGSSSNGNSDQGFDMRDLSFTMAHETANASGSGGSNSQYVDDLQIGSDTTTKEQVIIRRGYYDNAGAEHWVGFRLEHELDTAFDESTSEIHDLHAYDYRENFMLSITSPEKSAATTLAITSAAGNTLTRSETSTTSNTYTVEFLKDGTAQDSKSYTHAKAVSQTGDKTDYLLTSNNIGRGATFIYNSLPDTDSGDLFVVPGESISDLKVPYFGPDFGGSRVVMDNQASNTTYNTNTWGNAASSGTDPGNDEFDRITLNLVDWRFVSASHLDLAVNSPGVSIYGASADDHSSNISYDPYTAAITDSDDPIGYI